LAVRAKTEIKSTKKKFQRNIIPGKTNDIAEKSTNRINPVV
jgi:hypothetical protein